MTYTINPLNNQESAERLTKAIKKLAENPEALENFESYLSQHFDKWFEKYANTPESLAFEFEQFSQIY